MKIRLRINLDNKINKIMLELFVYKLKIFISFLMLSRVDL